MLPVSMLMAPFVPLGDLLPRSTKELRFVLQQAFVAETDGQVVGFAALEIYSWKLAEIQCLSFRETPLRQDIARQLVLRCAQLARWYEILEVLAIVPPALEDVLRGCGFDFALPNQKRALFICPADAIAPADEPPLVGVVLRDAVHADLAAVEEFLTPFVARGEVLPRSTEELGDLLRHALVADAADQVVGFAALEVYSEKLSEIQCLSVDKARRQQGIGRRLVLGCVQKAREHHVAETMAISLRDQFFVQCGFDHSVVGPKIAMFLKLPKKRTRVEPQRNKNVVKDNPA